MKRTGEIILTSIGVGLNAIASLIIGLIMFLSRSGNFMEEFKEIFLEQAASTGVDVSAADADMVLDLIGSIGWFAFALFVIFTILGGVAIYFYVGNKKSLAASLIVLITGAVIMFAATFIGVIPGLLYIIAGVVGLIRRDPIEPYTGDTMFDYVDEDQ